MIFSHDLGRSSSTRLSRTKQFATLDHYICRGKSQRFGEILEGLWSRFDLAGDTDVASVDANQSSSFSTAISASIDVILLTLEIGVTEKRPWSTAVVPTKRLYEILPYGRACPNQPETG